MSYDINAPLDFGTDVNKIDTSRPVVVAGPYRLCITNVEIKRNKRNDGDNLRVTFRIEDEATTETGTVLPAGTHYVFQYLPLDAENNKRVVQLFDAALGTKQGTRPENLPPAILLGKVVQGNVRVDPAQGEYDKSNSVGSVSFLRQ